MVARKAGFLSLPVSLKILFVIIALNIISSITGLMMGQTSSYPVFGALFSGTIGLVFAGIIGVLLPGLVLYALWEQEMWGWFFALIVLGLGIVNSLLGLAVLEELVVEALPEEFPADMIPLQVQIGVFMTYITSALTVLFMWFVFRHKKLFKA